MWQASSFQSLGVFIASPVSLVADPGSCAAQSAIEHLAHLAVEGPGGGSSGTGVPPVRIEQPAHGRDARATTRRLLEQLAESEFEVVHRRKGQHRTPNIEHRTSNVDQVASPRLLCSALDVGCWMLDVRFIHRLQEPAPWPANAH